MNYLIQYGSRSSSWKLERSQQVCLIVSLALMIMEFLSSSLPAEVAFTPVNSLASHSGVSVAGNWEPFFEENAAISGNPGAVNFKTGNGTLQNLCKVNKDTGITFGGIWLSDYNILMAGGAQPGVSSWNSLLIVSGLINAEKLMGWKGADFGIQFLQFNGENSNGQAGSVQGYNGLPGLPPLNRSEFYQLWYRQCFFDSKLVFRIGRTVPTYDFGNVCRPVTTQDVGLEIPALSGLIFTPIFVNPSLLGALPGYYNPADGVTVTLAPFKNSYLNYGFYNGALANGTQTGLVFPAWNSYYFTILEAGCDWIIAHRYPGQIGIGGWYQSGVLSGPPGITQNGTEGFYLFGGQRIWAGHPAPGVDHLGGKETVGKEPISAGKPGSYPSISMLYYYGSNNSQTLPINKSVGAGLTGFNLVPGRPGDSIGCGMAWSWLNPHEFQRPSELMFQAYYQAHLIGGAFLQPTLSYIPTPGASPNLPAAWALTMRFTLLF